MFKALRYIHEKKALRYTAVMCYFFLDYDRYILLKKMEKKIYSNLYTMLPASMISLHVHNDWILFLFLYFYRKHLENCFFEVESDDLVSLFFYSFSSRCGHCKKLAPEVIRFQISSI